MHLTVLIALVLGSAVGVIYQNNYFRELFMEIQQLEMELDRNEVEMGQLQLEKTTLAGYGRIERAARSEIGLVRPGREAIVYLKPQQAAEAKVDD